MGTASLSMGSLISTSSCAPSGDSRDKRGKVSDDDQFLFIGDDIAIAQTEYGKVQGYLLNHVYTFLGVPYGADTSGKNRFMPPQKPEPWTDVRPAVFYGNTAPQRMENRWPNNYGTFADHWNYWDVSEDCLYLNVWTPGIADGKKRPVLVWLHGGGFTNGSGIEQDGLLNNSHRGTGALVGAAIGAAVGGGAGNLIGKHMDKVKAEAEQVKNAQVETVTDANGLSAVKVTFASGILFPTNGSTLSSSAKTDLAQFAGVLKNNTDCEVSIQGYTDATGNDGINLPLSQKRAEAVYNYLASCGVTSRQVKNVQGLGSANPVVNTTAACAQNRRVEVYMYASQAMVNAANNGTLK